MRTIRAGLAVSTLLSCVVVATSPAASAVVAPVPPVVINEIYYHAPDGNPAADFLELANNTDAAVNLAGWCLDGVSLCLPGGWSVPARGFVIVPGHAFGGSLSNGGEKLRLLNAASVVVDQVEYDDAGMWPASADGEGASLSRRDPTADGNDPGNWSAALPSPAAENPTRGRGLLPYFKNVQHTVLPAPNAPLTVTATLVRGGGATLYYRIGFGGEVAVAMSPDPTTAGQLTAVIPGQAAGSLVRYRLVGGRDQAPGRRLELVAGNAAWPVVGDGATYTGTTVATSTTSKLPRFEWFMDDATYNLALHDLTLTGDDGYPAVFAYHGEIFDGTKIRVKGQVSRTYAKKKWKVSLPAGHELSIPGVLLGPIDEFALHGATTDKSFIRETISSEMMQRAGVPTSQAFPVRLEKNGLFYGLYSYVEQQDGAWRDRNGITDDAEVYEVGGGKVFGLLAAGDAGISQSAFRQKYDKETREWEDDRNLRSMIYSTNALTGAAERRWVYDHVDVPSVVNALAATLILQHHDWGHKNYRLVYSKQGRWQVVPTDFDLTLGLNYTISQGPFADVVSVKDPFEHPGTPLFNPFWFDAEFNSLLDRRVRTLSEELLAPAWIDTRIQQLDDLVREEAALDRQVWGTYGQFQVAEVAAGEMNGAYIAPRRQQIQGSFAASGRVATTPRTAMPDVRITGVQPVDAVGNPEMLAIKNFSATSVDLSGFRIDAVGLVVPGGTVLMPGVSAVFVTDQTGRIGGMFACCLFGGTYSGDIADAGELLQLANPDGDIVNQFRHGPAPAPPPLLDVVINEVAPSGTAGFLDEAAEVEPWFELYNRAPTTATLTGLSLVGAGGVTWTVPAGVTLAAGGHLVVIADGETGATLRHAPALLAASSTLVLRNAAGATVDTVAYGAQLYGRTPSGAAVAEDLLVATPGAANPLPRARVVLNEYNGVADNKVLKTGGSDTYWGQVLGNGGDWLELVVVTDHVDLRGWRVDVVDNAAAPVPLTLPADAGLADVRAGTIVTIAENPAVPTDYTVNPGAGDYWININMTGFDTSQNNTQITISDSTGRVVFGPAGEGVAPLVGGGGVGSDEALRLDANPSFSTTAAGPYIDVFNSTFGAPNAITGGTQDFSALRDTSRPGTPRLVGFDGLVPVISWDPPVGALASGYIVRRNGVQVGTVAGTGFRDTTAPQGLPAAYDVIAQLTLGGTGPASGTLSVSVPDNTLPVMAASIVPWMADRDMYRFYWPFATDNVGISSYRVYVNGRLTATTTSAFNWVELTNLPDPVPLYIEVYAVDTAGLRSATPATGRWVTGDGSAPGPTRSVGASVTRTTATVRWGFAVDVSSIVSYRITRTDNGQVITTTGHSTTFSGLAPSHGYVFLIQAVDKYGNVGYPAIIGLTTPA